MASSPTIRVLIVDDHTIVRDGLRNILEKEPDITVVGERSSAKDIVNAVRETDCNVLLMDLTMPGAGGLQGLAMLQAARISVNTLILTVHEASSRLHQAIAAGALGYLTKRASAQTLLEAVRTTAAGKAHIDSAVITPTPDVVLLESLSRREREVLVLVAMGHTNQEAAARLGVSPKSVEGYRRRMAQKIGASSRADIVRFALRHGLLSSSS